MLTKVRLLFLAASLLYASAAFGQTTAVSGNVTDTDGFPWASGTYTFFFIPGNSGQQYLDGVPFTPANINGSLDASGNFTSIVVNSNNHITPVNSHYNLQVCPNANAPCFIQPVLATGTTTTVTVNPNPVRVTGSIRSVPLAYDDSEIVGPIEGFVYFNYVLNSGRVYHNGVFEPFGSGGGGGTGLTSVGLTIQPGGIYSITNSPLIVNGNLNIIQTGVVGCVPYFSAVNLQSCSGVFTQDALIKGNNTNAPSSSTVTDNGTTPTRAPDGVNFAVNGAYLEYVNNGTGTVTDKLVCDAGSSTVTICPDNVTAGVLGFSTFSAGNSGTTISCVGFLCKAVGDGQWVEGDYAIPGTGGRLHDTGSNIPTLNNVNFKIKVINSGANTTGYVIPPGDMLGQSSIVIASCNPLTTLGDIIVGTGGTNCGRLGGSTTNDGVTKVYTSKSTAGVAGQVAVLPVGVVPFVDATTSPTILNTYRSGFLRLTNAGAKGVTIPALTGNFANNDFFCVLNEGAGAATYSITGGATINGLATYVQNQGDSVCFISDNTNLFTKESSPPLLAGTNITITRGAHGDTIAAAGGGAVSCANMPALTGDITTTAGSCATTLGAKFKINTCEVVVGDPGAASIVLADDNDSPGVCSNDSGATYTITGVHCFAPVGSPTVTPIITGGGATTILSGALTCSNTVGGAAGTLNGTPTQTNGQTIDDNITVAGGTAKYLVIRITRTL